MPNILQTISVRFVADVADFAKGLTGIQKNTFKFSNSMKKEGKNAAANFKMISSAALGAATVIGTTLAVGVAKATAEISKLVDEANQLGISLQQWQAFNYIATTMGTSVDTMKGAFFEMQKTVNEAAAGVVNANAAFNVLGIKFDEFKKLSPDQQFKTLAEALKNVEDKTLKSTLGTQIFGNKWKEINPIIDAGVNGLNNLQIEAAKMGQALSDEDLANVKTMGENWEWAKNLAMGFFNVIAANLAPIFNAVFDNFKKVATAGDNFANVGQLIQDVVITAIYMAIKAIDYLRAGIKAGEAVLLYLTGGFFAMGEGAVKAINFILSYVEKGFNQIIEVWNKMPWVDEDEKVGKINLQFTETAQYLEDMRKGILNDAGKVMGEAGEIAANGWAEKFIKNANEKVPLVSNTIGKAVAQAVTATSASVDAANKAGPGIDKPNKATPQDLKDEQDRLNRWIKDNEQLWEDLRGATGTFFKDALSGTKSLGESFKDLTDTIVDMALEMYVIKPLLNNIFGAAGTTSGGWIGMAASFFGGSATGGFIPAGMPRYVHENELIVPAADSYVVNSRKVDAMYGNANGSINQVFNITSNDPASVRREINKMRPTLRNDALIGYSAGKSRRKVQ